MPQLMTIPYSQTNPVTEMLHGVPVVDPYRWLEDQTSESTRAWLGAQTLYARTYLDLIPSRDRIRERIREFLAVDTHGCLLKTGEQYLFRKRLANEEQASIFMRNGVRGEDQLLIDPLQLGDVHTAVRPILVSPDNRILVYEVKQGGERTSKFELFDIKKRCRLADSLPRGYLRGLVFSPDCQSFYYVHESSTSQKEVRRAAYQHFLGTGSAGDREVFCAGEDRSIRLALIGDNKRLIFLVYRFADRRRVDLYDSTFEPKASPRPLLLGVEHMFGPRLSNGRIFAISDRNAPNRKIVELADNEPEPDCIDVVAECDVPIYKWHIVGDRIFVSYTSHQTNQVHIFDLSGRPVGTLPMQGEETIRILGGSEDGQEMLFEAESFLEPPTVCSYLPKSNERTVWARRTLPFDEKNYGQTQDSFAAKDGLRIPISLVGRREVLDSGCHPTIMTAYGGFGVPMTPQFSVFATFLMERGCLFALPNIRGGSEFGAAWHASARRRNRQTAFDDFLAAAEWLIQEGRTQPDKLAIFGGSNAGLLVGAALTQRPDLFRAVVCMVPILDMLRYHLFDNAGLWKEEFGTADDPEDFTALYQYSPYHAIKPSVRYPAVMFVSGDSDQNCNALHARKMTAKMQASTSSPHPIILDYSNFRGHSPVLPLNDRIEALTDRMAFICDQLGLAV